MLSDPKSSPPTLVFNGELVYVLFTFQSVLLYKSLTASLSGIPLFIRIPTAYCIPI
jgi:hypothetical protein